MSKVLWTQKQDIGPSARSGHAVTYDTSRKRTLLHGGGDARGDCADTWEWDGNYWVQVQDVGPPALAMHSVAFDRSRSRGVLFGGRESTGVLNKDTWEWDGTDWTQVQDIGPRGRHSTAMCFDAERERVVLFGGLVPDAMALGDTWEWDGVDWTEVSDIGPSPRHAHSMCFDRNRGRTVLFGGSGDSAFADTWEWDGSLWTQVADSGPDTAVGGSLSYCGTVSSLFGGVSDVSTPTPTFRRDTWDWDGSRWTRRQNMGPPARAFHGATYDSDRGRVVLFGGMNAVAGPDVAAHLMGDTWEHAVEIHDALESPAITMLVSPSTVRFGSFISVDFTVANVRAVPIHLSVVVGNEIRPAQVPAMTPQLSVKIAVDTDVMPYPAQSMNLEVVARIEGSELRERIIVQP